MKAYSIRLTEQAACGLTDEVRSALSASGECEPVWNQSKSEPLQAAE